MSSGSAIEFNLGDRVTYGYNHPRDCVVAGIMMVGGPMYFLVEGDDCNQDDRAWRDWIHQGTSDGRPLIRGR